MTEQDPVWEFLKRVPSSEPDGSLASRTLARLALEKSRRSRWTRFGRIGALLLLLLAGGGGYAAWLASREQGQEAALIHSALSSIDSNPAAEDVGWLQDQLAAEPGDKGETVLWEEANSF